MCHLLSLCTLFYEILLLRYFLFLPRISLLRYCIEYTFFVCFNYNIGWGKMSYVQYFFRFPEYCQMCDSFNILLSANSH